MKKKSKIIFTLFIVILCIALTILLIPFVKLLSTEQGRDIIDEKISSLGIFAPLAFICLEILQIVAAFVPGAPVEILGRSFVWRILGRYPLLCRNIYRLGSGILSCKKIRTAFGA